MIPTRRSFLSGTVAVAGGMGAPFQNAAAPLQLGVVNVRQCFDKDKYARMAEALEDLGKLRQQFLKEGAELQKKIASLKEMMDAVSPNGELYVEKTRLCAHAEYDLKLLQEVARRRLRDRAADLESRVYADLRRVVAKVARTQNLDVVLRVDDPRTQEEDPEANALQRLLSREVLFHRDALDVTAQVLAGLNAEWARAWPCAACKRKVA